MIENVIILVVIAIITTFSKNRGLSILICVYYGFYILLEFDFFGRTVGNIFTTHDDFIAWYLICTASSCFFSLVATYLFVKGNNYAGIYSFWLLVNACISGFMAIMQSFETNTGLFVYNIIQNINLFVDLLIVILGTDNPLRRNKCATCIVDFIDRYVNNWFGMDLVLCYRNEKCNQTS